MKKVYVLPANEDWIVDRMAYEWSTGNKDITVNDPRESDVVWLMASWCWQRVPQDVLRNKKVLATVHHVVEEKFDHSRRQDFIYRDQFVDCYHVYNQKTKEFIESLTKKPIHLLKYWANQELWKKTSSKASLRKKYGIPDDVFVIGSFQRDTEGSDLKTPKLEKGPDIFAKFVEEVSKEKSIHVVLAGWRRQYVIGELSKRNIPYTYFEKPPQDVVNELYQTLDLYPVTSRVEGGPQSLIECGLLEIPVVSRDVGISRQVLPSCSIGDDLMKLEPRIPSVEDWHLPNAFKPYRDLIESLV